MPNRHVSIGVAVLLALVVGASTLAAQRATSDAMYSDAQAVRGDALYAENCAQCHRYDLTGGDLAPALTGVAFFGRWSDKPLAELFDYMRTAMPLNSAGGLSAGQNIDLLAFLLKKGGYPVGKADLKADALKTLRVSR